MTIPYDMVKYNNKMYQTTDLGGDGDYYSIIEGVLFKYTDAGRQVAKYTGSLTLVLQHESQSVVLEGGVFKQRKV